MTVAFRLAREGDLPALAANRWRMRVEEDGEPRGVDPAVFRRHCEAFLGEALRSGRWALWVAEAEGRLVANAFVQVVPKVPRPGRFDDAIGYVTNVFVEPGQRGRGVGTELAEPRPGLGSRARPRAPDRLAQRAQPYPLRASGIPRGERDHGAGPPARIAG